MIESLRPWVCQIQAGSTLDVAGSSDLILIEADFPFSKIYKFLKSLQRSESTACIILMGPALDACHLIAFLQAGVFDYLKIPFPPRRLRKAIHKGLKNRESLLKILKLSNELEAANKALSEERDQLKRWNRDLTQLYTLNQSLSESLQIAEVVSSFMDHVNNVAPCDVIALYLNAWNKVYIEADYTKSEILIDQVEEETLQEGIALARSKRTPSRAIALNDGREIRIPLEIGSEKVGLLRLLHMPIAFSTNLTQAVSRNNLQVSKDLHVEKPFSHRQLKLVSMIAAPLAIAIRNAEMYRKVEDLAVKDALTGILNRRAFSSILEREFMRADRYHTPLALMVIDLDHFKHVNDSYGHLAGDQVLQEVARTFTQSLRDIDVLIRYGGEEFVVILPGTSIHKGLVVANRIKDRVEKTVFHEDDPIKMTVSIGLADTLASGINSPEDLFQQADQALYAAKRNGRNLIMTPDKAPWEAFALIGARLGGKRSHRNLAST